MAKARSGREDVRDDILRSAVALFGERSFRGTSLAAVAERAGVTDAGILYHFGSKQELLMAALRHADAGFAHDMADAIARGGVEALAEVGRWGEQMEAAAELSALYLQVSAEHLTDESAAHDFFVARYDAMRAVVEALFVQAVERGELRADVDARIEAAVLIAVLDGIRFQHHFVPGTIGMGEAVRHHVTTTIARLRPA